MKKFVLIFLTALSFVSLSCRKSEIIEPTQPILIKVEAVHVDGNVVSSDIIMVR